VISVDVFTDQGYPLSKLLPNRKEKRKKEEKEKEKERKEAKKKTKKLHIPYLDSTR
jgi:PAB1-binding protein PBP1